jgi:TrmH family RNA methyltransferase
VTTAPEPLGSGSGPVRRARALTRRSVRVERRQFLADGPQAVRESLGGSVGPPSAVEVLATPDAWSRHRELAALADRQAVPTHRVEPAALAGLTGSVSPQGIVAVCRMPGTDLAVAVAGATSCAVVGVHVRDPGNAGSLLRCADASGAAPVIFAGTCVDPFNDKSVRASAGSIFHLPLAVEPSVDAVLDALRAAGVRLLAADAHGDVPLAEAADHGLFDGPVGWLFGNEAWGFEPEVLAQADAVVSVPIYGRAESLNVSMAATVCLYETARVQRLPGS